MSNLDLSVRIAGLRLESPVLAASGTFGAGREAAAFLEPAQLGAIIVKSTTLEPWAGKGMPRVCETPSGMLNAIGIQNKGVDHFITQDLPWLVSQRATVIASIAGNTVGEYVAIARKLRARGRGVAAVEVNISCPNLEDRNLMFAHSARSTAEVVQEVKRVLRGVPVFAKLSPNVTSLVEIAGAALDADADGLSLINTVFGMAIDVETRRPKIAGVVGGLSGPAIHPIAVRAVHDVHRAFPHAPIIGQGGVTSGDDALQLLLAGASAVAVGTANFRDPTAALAVARGIAEHMDRHGVTAVSELVGAVKLE